MTTFEEHDKEFIKKAEAHPVIRCNRSEHWRLVEGMLVTGQNGIPVRVIALRKKRAFFYDGVSNPFWADAKPKDYWPVLDDSGTLGGLIKIVRSVWGANTHCKFIGQPQPHTWVVYNYDSGGEIARAPKEINALIRALEVKE